MFIKFEVEYDEQLVVKSFLYLWFYFAKDKRGTFN